jgi:hypothetical protein
MLINPGFYEDERLRGTNTSSDCARWRCFRKYLGSSTRITWHSFWKWCAMHMGRAQRLCAVDGSLYVFSIAAGAFGESQVA